MKIKLPFKAWSGIREKEVDIILKIGTLEDLCEELGIEFWQIKDYMTKNSFDFSHLLLWYGYLTACEKNHTKVKYGKEKAAIWYEYMSQTEKTKFINEMSVLFGKIVKAYSGKKKVVKKSNSLSGS